MTRRRLERPLQPGSGSATARPRFRDGIFASRHVLYLFLQYESVAKPTAAVVLDIVKRWLLSLGLIGLRLLQAFLRAPASGYAFYDRVVLRVSKILERRSEGRRGDKRAVRVTPAGVALRWTWGPSFNFANRGPVSGATSASASPRGALIGGAPFSAGHGVHPLSFVTTRSVQRARAPEAHRTAGARLSGWGAQPIVSPLRRTVLAGIGAAGIS